MENGKLLLIICFNCGKGLKADVIQEHVDECVPSEKDLPAEYKDLFNKLNEGATITEEEITVFNMKADKLFKEVSLIPCPNCGRKFYHDRVEVHMKSCKGDPKSKKKTTITKGTNNNYNDDSQKLFLQKLEKELQNEGIDNNQDSFPDVNNNNDKTQKSKGKQNPMAMSITHPSKKLTVPTNEIDSESNKIFLANLEKELKTQEAQEQPSNNKPTNPLSMSMTMKKKKEETTENSNKLFLEKLNKELKNEHEPEVAEIESMKIKKNTPINKPLKYNAKSNLYTTKKTVKSTTNEVKEIDSNQKFKELLDKELSKEGDNYKIVESSTSTTTNTHKTKEKKSPLKNKVTQSVVKKSNLKVSNIMCFICGKDYGSSSLSIHMKTCETNWRKEHPTIDPNTERPKACDNLFTQIKEQTLTQVTIDTYIKQAEKAFRNLNYFPCPNCGNKYLSERLYVHLRGCHPSVEANSINSTKLFEEKLAKQLDNDTSSKSKTSTPPNTNHPVTNTNEASIDSQSNEISNVTPINNNNIPGVIALVSNTKDENNNTKTENTIEANLLNNGEILQTNGCSVPLQSSVLLICYICGKEFSKESIEKHLDSCMEKNKDIHTILPRELEKIFAKIENDESQLITKEEIEDYNRKAEELLQKNSMKTCPGCRRRFLPSPYEIHLRSCKIATQTNANNEEVNKTNKEQENASVEKELIKDNTESNSKLPNELKDNKSLEEEKQTTTVLDADDLVPCEKCGRKFLQERIQIHLRMCKEEMNQ